ncbi:MAG: hypothetical protein ACLFPL_01710 [Candidatus Nanoarchaeia archaeon]
MLFTIRFHFYLQLFFTVLLTFFIFSRESDLLFILIILICFQIYSILRFSGLFALLYAIIQLSFIGLINIPYIGLVFAVIYLLFSLFILSILSNSNALNSQFRVYTNKNSGFSPDFDIKRAYSKYKQNSFSSLFGTHNSKNKKSSSYQKKSSHHSNIKPSKFDTDAKDAEFKEK